MLGSVELSPDEKFTLYIGGDLGEIYYYKVVRPDDIELFAALTIDCCLGENSTLFWGLFRLLFEVSCESLSESLAFWFRCEFSCS